MLKQYIISETMKGELDRTGRTTETAVNSPYWQRFYEELAGQKDFSLLPPYEFAIITNSPALVKLRYLQDIGKYPIDYLCRVEKVEKLRQYGQDGKSRGLFLKIFFVLEKKIEIEADRPDPKKSKRR